MRQIKLTSKLFTTIVLITLSTPVIASDYVNECQTASGHYKIFDGELQRAQDSSRTNISYKILSRKTLEKSEGYCLSNASEAAGQKFRFGSETYLLHIRFRDGGQPLKMYAICEMASDGLPAAYNCDKRVDGVAALKSTDDGSQKTDSGGKATAWNHNGSIMRLEADGKTRKFIYDEPRDALKRRGVRAGITLFSGRRDGDRYVGKSRIFNRTCGQITYRVSGKVSENDTRVTLAGSAPRLNSFCDIVGYKRDVLVFDLVK